MMESVTQEKTDRLIFGQLEHLKRTNLKGSLDFFRGYLWALEKVGLLTEREAIAWEVKAEQALERSERT